MITKFDIENFFRFRSQVVCYGFFKIRLVKGKQINHDFDIGYKSYLPLLTQNHVMKLLVFKLQSKEKTSLSIETKNNPFKSFLLQLNYLALRFLKLASKKKKLNLLRYVLKSYVIKKKFKGYILLLFGNCVYLPRKYSFFPFVGSCILVKLLSFVKENTMVSQRILINSKSKNLSKFYLYQLI